MKQNIILSYIAKSQRRRLLCPLLLLMTVLFLAMCTSLPGYLSIQTLQKDQPLTDVPLQNTAYVRSPVSCLYYTGQDCWDHGTLVGHFYYTLCQDTCQFYILRASSGVPAAPYLEDVVVSGRLDSFGPELDTLAAGLADTLDWTKEGVLEASSSYYINGAAYLNIKELFLIILLCLVLIGDTAVLIRTVVYWRRPQLTPACRRLRKYGNPDSILRDAQKQLSRQIRIRTKDMVLTPDYLIEFSEDLSAIIPLESILWTYDHAALRHTLKGKQLSYTIHVVTVYGDEYNLRRKSAEDVRVIYNELTTRYPNYFYGYSKEHQTMVRHLIQEMKREQ